MGKDKHEPKDSKKKFEISDDAEKTLIGLMLVVISLIGLLNRGLVGQFLTYIFTYAFGAFYFIFFLFLIFLGIYLIVKKKSLSFRLNLNFLAFTLIFFAALIAASLTNDSLNIKNVFSQYHSQMESLSNGIFHIESLANVGVTGGGFIGYFITALLNSAVTSLGTQITVATFLVIGLFILLRKPVSIFIKKVKASIVARKARKEEQERAKEEARADEKEEGDESKEEINPVVKEKEESEKTPAAPVIENKIPQTHSPFSIRPATSKPRTNPMTPEEKDSYLVRQDEVEEEVIETNESEQTETIPTSPRTNPLLSLLRRPKSEKVNETVEEDIPEEIEYDDAQETDNIALERSDRKLVSPLEKSYGTSKTVTDARPGTVYEMPGAKKSVPPPTPSVERKYLLPSISLLSDHQDFGKYELNAAAAVEKSQLINQTFDNFGIKFSVVSYTIGPSVTRYNVKGEQGARLNQLSGITSELQVGLRGDMSVRVEQVIQGHETSGIEVGNPAPTTVPFKTCFAALMKCDKLCVPFGQRIDGDVCIVNLKDLPHLLVAGATGSGKSVFVQSLIMSLIMRNYPDELKLILVDPKRVEFIKYQNIPHLYCPIINDADVTTAALFKLVSEMERRYTLLARYEVVKIEEYYALAKDRPDLEKLPNIVVIIDEFADLILEHAKEIEPLIQRLTQKARAAGIYLIIATQRPTVNVITGTIKSNIPARVALSVSSAIDSRAILDETGAETLVGKGDLLARIPGVNLLQRLQSPFVDNEEITRVVKYLREQDKPNFNPEFLNLEAVKDEDGNNTGSNRMEAARKKGSEDEYYEEIKHYVLETQTASTSSIMRYYGLGYGRAAAILDSLEDEGIIKTVGTSGRKTVIKTIDDID